MSEITKNILKAVFVESIGTILLGSVSYALFFSLAETKEFFEVLWLPILAGFTAMCFAGRALGNSFSPSFKFNVWHGIVIVFALLFIAIIVGVMATLLLPNWDKIGLQDVFSVILVFLSFGGLPTLVVGVWLGNALKKLSKI